MKAFRKALVLILVPGTLFLPATAIASPERGAQWLAAQQQESGAIVSEATAATSLQSTAESLLTLTLLERTGDVDLQSTLDYIGNNPDYETVENLCRRILVHLSKGLAFDDLLDQLFLHQYPGAGYGFYPGYGSDVLSTAHALQVLSRAEITDRRASSAIGFLLQRQKEDGSWSLQDNTPNTALTAQAMLALWEYRRIFNVQDALEMAGDYLLRTRNVDHLWDDLNTTSQVLIALSSYLVDRSGLAESIAALQDIQSPQGDFNQDTYSTALAVRALFIAETPAPDEITIGGTLIDGDSGIPIAGATIAVTGEAELTAPSSIDGTFLIRAIPPGSYSVIISKDGYHRLSLNASLGVGSKADLGVLQLSKYQTDPDTGMPVATGTVRGEVSDRRTGRPVAGAIVSVRGTDLSAVTGATGSYQLNHVPAGHVILQVQAGGYGSIQTSVELARGYTLIFSPALSAATLSGVLIEGVVIERDSGMPLPGASIEVYGGGEVIASAQADLNGRYEITGLPVGELTVAAFHDGYHAVSVSIEAQDGARFIYSPQMDPVSGDVQLSTGSFTGIVVDAVNGRGLSDVSVSVEYPEGEMYCLMTGPDGEIVTGNLPVGDASATFNLEGYDTEKRRVFIQGDLETDIGEIPMNPEGVADTARAFGCLVDIRNSVPVSGGIISAENLDAGMFFETISLDDGSFVLDGLIPGEYQVTISASGYSVVTFNMITTEGEGLDLGEVRLRAPGVDELLPDLSILALDVSLWSSDPTSFELSGTIGVTIINRGNAAVKSPFQVYAYEDLAGEGMSEEGNRLFGVITVQASPEQPLNADSTRVVTMPLSGVQSFRDAPIIVHIDPKNIVAELSKENNRVSTASACTNETEKPNLDLCLCMDSSGSISNSEFQLQLEGTARAIEDENIVPRDGSVRISAFQFAGSTYDELSPTVVEEGNVHQIAETIRSIRKRGGGTSIHSCVIRASDVLYAVEPESVWKVIDVSTDGRSDYNSAVAASAKAGEMGIDVINAIGVGTNIDINLLNAIVFPQPPGGERGFVEVISGYQEYIEAIAGKMQRETRLPDLTVGGARLIDNGLGEAGQVSFILGNAGASAISEDVIMSVYDGDPGGNRIIAESVFTEGLPIDCYEKITLDGVYPSDFLSGTLVVAAGIDAEFTECNRENNRHSIPVHSTLGSISLTLDKSLFGPAETVSMTANVTNAGSRSGAYRVALAIYDLQGIEVHRFDTFETGEIPSSGSDDYNRQWNTGHTAAASYNVEARLYSLGGGLLDTSEVAFTITHLDSDQPDPDPDPEQGIAAARIRATTDRPGYHVNDTVVIDVLVRNITTNLSIENAVAHVTVINPGGNIVHDQTRALETLVPGQTTEFKQTLVLAQAPEGSYQLAVQLRSRDGVLYGGDRGGFVVADDIQRALRGGVRAAHPILYAGENQTCTYTVTNSGTAAVPGVSIDQMVICPADETVIEQKTRDIDLPVGAVTEDSIVFSTSGFQPGTYACVLDTNINGEKLDFSYALFRVEASPINMDGELSIGSQGRLLVLVDPIKKQKENRDDSSTIYLRRLLEDAGWLVTIVDTGADFKREMDTGGYSLYALFSESVYLDKETQEKLNVMAAGGDGLLAAGGHDRRNVFIEESLGVSLRGNVPHACGVAVDHSELGDPWSEMFSSSTKRLNFVTQGAVVIGRYIDNYNFGNTDSRTHQSVGCDPNPCGGFEGEGGENAISVHEYFNGRSVFVGFDLLSEAELYHRRNQDSSNNPFASFMLSALAYINPDPLVPRPGTVVPVIVDVHNLGMATDGKVMLNFSDNLTVVDGGELTVCLDSGGRTWEYSFFMQEDESLSMMLYVRLPGESADSSRCCARRCPKKKICLNAQRSIGCDSRPLEKRKPHNRPRSSDPDSCEEEVWADLLIQSGLEPYLTTHVEKRYSLVLEQEN